MEREIVERTLSFIENKRKRVYDIEDAKENWSEYVKWCKTDKEKLQILMCLYMVNTNLDELTTWTKDEFLNYARYTDQDYEDEFYNGLLETKNV